MTTLITAQDRFDAFQRHVLDRILTEINEKLIATDNERTVYTNTHLSPR